MAFGKLTAAPLWAQPASALPSSGAAAWAEKPMRWAQLTLVEDDPGKFDPAFWLDYFKQTKSDGVCLSAGGCVAYYPTQVPFHHRSAWLDNRDVLGELIARMPQARHDRPRRAPTPTPPTTMSQAAHPDWIAVDAEGKPRRHWASPEMWVTCALGPYNFEFMTDVHKEIMSRYHPDGIFINRWDGSGMCYCEHCRANFKAATGFDLPRTDDPQDPARRAYIALAAAAPRSRCSTSGTPSSRKINPDACVIPNNGGGAHARSTRSTIGALAPMLVADRQARQRPHCLRGSIGKTAKEYRATMGDKPVVGLFGVGLEEPYRWKDSVQGNAEIRIWALEGIANGMRPWFSKFCGTLHDERWLKGVEDLYVWAAKNERYLRHETPDRQRRPRLLAADRAGTTAAGARRPKSKTPPSAGTRPSSNPASPSRWSTTACSTPAISARFKTLILPNIAALSDAQCDQLRAFVASGGNLIATSETSLYDELGAPPQRLRPRRSVRRRPGPASSKAPCRTPTSAWNTKRCPTTPSSRP